MPMLLRKLAIEPATFNPDERSFDALLSTGADVRRRDARGSFTERLDLSRVDVPSLVGLPVLDGHRQDGSEHAVGTITAARMAPEGIVATIRLSAADDVRSIATKVSEGVLRGVSIGYSAASRTETTERSARVVTIVPKIHEASIVAIPADPAAIIRKEPEVPAPIENPENDNETVQHRAAVRAIARAAGMDSAWADEQIDSCADVTEIRAAAFEAMTSRRSPVIRTHAPANDDPAVIATRRADALFARVNGTTPDDACRAYVNDGLVDHARAFLVASGHAVTGMDRETILRSAMHTTSDFPNLLTGVGNRTLLPAYQAAQSPLKSLARQALANDFRTMSRLKLGEIGTLKKVSESGEIKSTTRGEAAESYAIDTYGSLFALSRKAIVNDDLGAFRDWGIAAGRAAAATEADLLFALLTQSNGAGPVMGEDNKRLFHADHGNVAASGAALSAGSYDELSAARLALRTMKGIGGNAIAVTPKFLLVGPEQETVAEQLITATTPIGASDVNPFAGNLTVLVEPRITDNSWFVFADPAQLAVLEFAYLASAQGPQMASREGWDVLGMEFRVTLDFGAGAVDYRGAYRNPGA